MSLVTSIFFFLRFLHETFLSKVEVEKRVHVDMLCSVVVECSDCGPSVCRPRIHHNLSLCVSSSITGVLLAKAWLGLQM